MVSYELYYDGKRIFRAKGKESRFLKHSLYLEALQDRVANINQSIEKNGDFTVITEYTDKDNAQFIPEYDFLLAPINHLCKTINSTSIKYNSQMAISEHDFSYLSVQILRYLLSELVDLGLEIIVFKNASGYKFRDYADNFWNRNSR